MKRKSGRKVSKKDEENSNGVDIDSKSEQNGDTSDHDEDEAPKDKKRKSSKGSSRKSVSFSSKKEEAAAESEKSDDQENDDDPKEEKKRSSKSGRKASKKDDDESLESDEEEEENNQEKKKSSKKGRKSAPKEDKGAQDSEDQDEDDESQYEVEAVLDEKMIKGVRHYLIRWKGYEEESDTWEPEGTLDCDRLIELFKENKKKGVKPKKIKKEKKEIKTPDWDENEDFEVDKILEVHHRKNGKREFLVSWKGYGSADNSWEPEENMDCKDLIAKFMAKVEKAREVDERELRVNRPHVQRYTLSTQATGRRLSKRFSGKERVQYHDAE